MYLISNFLGKLIIHKESKFYNLRSLFGFAFLASILEILYLPFMISESSKYFPDLTLLLLGALFIVAIFNTEREDFFFLKSPIFYFLVILGLFIFKIYYPLDAGDDSFYLPFIRDLAAKPLFSINPRTGLAGTVQSYYVFQGYYFMLSSLNSFFNSSLTILFVFKFYMSFIFITFLAQLIEHVKEYYKIKSKIFIIIFLIAIFLLGYPSLTHIYWGSFALFPVFIPAYILVFKEYLEKKSLFLIMLLVLLNVAMIFLSSSSLFLLTLIACSFLFLDLYTSKVKSFDYVAIILPNLIYLSLFVARYFWLYILIGIVVLMYFFQKYIDKYVVKYFKYSFIAVPIVLYAMAIYLGIKNNWESYNLGYLILIFNIFISGLILYSFKKKQKFEIIPAVFVIYIISFFNPFSSKMIAAVIGTEVYHRLFFMTKNPLMIIIILYYLYDFFKDYHASKYIYNAFLVGLLLIYGKVILNASFLNSRYYAPYNYIFREEAVNLDLAKHLPNGNYISIYYQPRSYNSKVTGMNYRYQGLGPMADHSVNRYLSEVSFDSEDAYKEIKTYDYVLIFNDKGIKAKLPDFEKYYVNERYAILKRTDK